jgi:alpha-tubulin suppressor-like RCC1 family protein
MIILKKNTKKGIFIALTSVFCNVAFASSNMVAVIKNDRNEIKYIKESLIFEKVFAGAQNSFALDSKGNVWATGDNELNMLGFFTEQETINTFTKTGLTEIKEMYTSNISTLAVDKTNGVWANFGYGYDIETKTNEWHKFKDPIDIITTEVMTKTFSGTNNTDVINIPANAENVIFEITNDSDTTESSFLAIRRNEAVDMVNYEYEEEAYESSVVNMEHDGSTYYIHASNWNNDPNHSDLSPYIVDVRVSYEIKDLNKEVNFKRLVLSDTNNYYFAIDENNDLWGIGRNRNNNLGIKGLDFYDKWRNTGLSDVIDVGAGHESSYAVTSAGELWVTGSAFGTNHFDKDIVFDSFGNIEGWKKTSLTNVKMAEVGSGHGYALLNDGTMLSIGRNNYSQLGRTGAEEEWLPMTNVPQNVKEIKAFRNRGYLITEEGELYVVGRYIRDPVTLADDIYPTWTKIDMSPSSDYSIGDYHDLKIINGKIYGKGTGTKGELGSGSYSNSFNDWIESKK